MKIHIPVVVCAIITACSPCVAQLHVVPSLCGEHGAYDLHRDRVVTFDNATNTTRLFNGLTWEVLATPTIPPTPYFFVYDAARRRILNIDHVNVWEWDGRQWANMGPSAYVQPSSSYFGSPGAYDAAAQRVVMLALAPNPNGMNAELREWNGSGWTTRANSAIAARPSPFGQYIYHAMQYDPLRRRLVLFGRTEVLNSGSLVASLPLTWEWDRQAGWVQFPASGAIGATTMWFDQHRGRMMRHDWSTTLTISLRDPNGTWQPVGASGLTIAVGGYSYDSKRNRLYKNWNGGGYLTSTHPAEYEPHGSGCATSAAPRLTLSKPWSRAWAGHSLSVTVMPNVAAVHAVAVLATGLSDTAWGSAPLPLALDAFGMPGCTLRVAPDVLDLGAGGNGGITFQLAVPANPALHGAAFWQQAFVLDAFANAAGLRASNSMRATVGQMQ